MALLGPPSEYLFELTFKTLPDIGKPHVCNIHDNVITLEFGPFPYQLDHFDTIEMYGDGQLLMSQRGTRKVMRKGSYLYVDVLIDATPNYRYDG